MFHLTFKSRRFVLGAVLAVLSAAGLIAVHTPDWVVPLVMLGLLKLTGIVSGTLLTACIIQASAPSANNTVMFSAKYGRDTGVASKTVAFISFASVLTMPVMIALTQL